jgi:hypothetical protein
MTKLLYLLGICMQTFGEELDIEGFEVDYSVSIHVHGATTLAFLQFFLKNKLKKTTKYFWFQSRAPINPLVAYVSGTENIVSQQTVKNP